jgi:RES domain
VTAPLPPDDLAKRSPNVQTLRSGVIVHRFYTAAYDPLYFDRGRGGRLNAPDGSYGVLYVARTRKGAFAETFLREPGRTIIPSDLLARKAYVQVRIEKTLRVVRLHGPGLARLGATAEVVHGGLPYDVPQAWSKALRDHPSKPDGIAYYARHDDEELCFALFDHAQVSEGSREVRLDQNWFWGIADEYDIGSPP